MDTADTSRYPIGVVARRTGLSTHVIRVWERRYGAVHPRRTDGNRRLYTDRDIERLRLLHSLTRAGHAISQVAALPLAELRALSLADVRSAAAPNEPAGPGGAADPEATALLDRCTGAVRELDAAGLEQALLEAHRALSLPVLLNQVVVPLLHWVGQAWRFGAIRVAQEHLMSGVLRQFLTGLRNAFRPPAAAPAIIVGTLPDQEHELGALMAAAVAAAEGWDVYYLGPNLPVDELAHAAILLHARAVAVSIVYPADDPRTGHDLEALRRYLPEETGVFAGGQGAAAHAETLRRIGASLAEDLDAFRNALRTWREH